MHDDISVPTAAQSAAFSTVAEHIAGSSNKKRYTTGENGLVISIDYSAKLARTFSLVVQDRVYRQNEKRSVSVCVWSWFATEVV